MYKPSAQQYKLGFWKWKERINVLNTAQHHITLQKDKLT